MFVFLNLSHGNFYSCIVKFYLIIALCCRIDNERIGQNLIADRLQ